jgi:tryptophan synthase alpha chain
LLTDLPPEHGDDLLARAAEHGIAAVLLVAPTTSDLRLQMIAARTTGFVYCIAVRGITGARRTTTEDALHTVRRLRATSDRPVVVGFGISTAQQVRDTCRFADGVVVGSALVEWIQKHADAVDLEAGFRLQVEELARAAHE